MKKDDPAAAAVKAMLDAIPMPICALAMVRTMKITAVEDPPLGERMLESWWLIVSEELLERSAGGLGAPKLVQLAALILERYFCNHGDWSAMEAGLRQRLTRTNPGLSEATLVRITDSLTSAVKDAIKTGDFRRMIDGN